MQKIEALRACELEDLLNEAWEIRNNNFPHELVASTPGAKTYVSDYHQNRRNSFVNISVTGTDCALDCEHCKGGLLGNMIPVKNSKELMTLADCLADKGCGGVLISGGSTKEGDVPLEGFFEGMAYLKSRGLKVLVHTGLASEDTARKLKEAGIDQALLDIISGFTGQPLTADDVSNLGMSVLKAERDFNARAGFTAKDDRLPDYFKKEPIAPHNVTFQVTDEELDTVFNF